MYENISIHSYMSDHLPFIIHYISVVNGFINILFNIVMMYEKQGTPSFVYSGCKHSTHEQTDMTIKNIFCIFLIS